MKQKNKKSKQIARTPKIEVYDTTLRDGSQSQDVAFEVEDKLRVAQKLDQLGVDFIEGGWPGANPKDTEFFLRAQTELKLKTAKLSAFGSTRRYGLTPAEDPVLKGLLDSQAPIICLFGKTWDLHVKTALGIQLKDNLELIEDSIAYLKSKKRKVFFDAEHFFDGYRDNPEYALKALLAAQKGGADRIILCDTNGGVLPAFVYEVTSKVLKKIKIPLGIHCHNDSGLAVANSLEAVRAGAIQVQGTINGIGERCGNANLCTLVPNLVLKQGYKALTKEGLAKLRSVSVFVDEMANRPADIHQPYVGQAAFAHKGGVHVSAVLKEPRTYEHIKPELLGNSRRLLISEQSGVATLLSKLKSFKISLKKEDGRTKQLLARLKELENQGYQFEGAEASFEMLIKRELGLYRPHFELKKFTVLDEVVESERVETGLKPVSTANITIKVNDQIKQGEATGVGPVHALDCALRGALQDFYPHLAKMQLLDYKVRVLPGTTGTASRVRVLIECGDGKTKWGTVGVSQNIIDASYRALVDAIDFCLT